MSKMTKCRTVEICADCGSPDPSWGSLNRGILICAECCTVHRSLGRHISEVRSLKYGYWSQTLSTMVKHLYASGANNIWEYALMDPMQSKNTRRKPQPNDQLHPNKSDFIRKKYLFLAFLNKQKDGDVCTVEDLSKQLHSSVRTNNLETCLRLLSKGADPNYFNPERGNCPIHVAAQAGQVYQVELLVIYGADPGAADQQGKTPVDYAVVEGHLDLADRLIECQYQLTDRLSFYLCNRHPDHKSGQHFLIPEVAESNLDLTELAKNAKKRLQTLPNVLFEELAKDVYDEVDRRQNDTATADEQTTQQSVLHLPLNPEFSATRNQGRQKLARLNPREFATLIIDVLSDAKRRQQGGLSTPVNDTNGDDMYDKHSLTKRHSSAEEEPIYDVVADEDDTSSMDTTSFRSTRKVENDKDSNVAQPKDSSAEEIRPASYVSLTDNESLSSEHQDISLSMSEYREMQRKLQQADKNMLALTQTNQTLNQEIASLKSQIQELENQKNAVELLVNGAPPSPTRANQDDQTPASGKPRNYGDTRPRSMFEARSVTRCEVQQTNASSPGIITKDELAPESLTQPQVTPTRRASDYDNSNTSLSNSFTERSKEVDETRTDDSINDVFPEENAAAGRLPTQGDVIFLTDKISKKIRELMQLAQEKQPSSFILCANSIFLAVREIIALFPSHFKDADVKSGLNYLLTNTLELQSECQRCTTNDMSHEDLQAKTKRVIQYAYDVAMAAREVVCKLPLS